MTLRTPEHRYWFRNIPEPWTRKDSEAPWRADAPWFRDPECLATYDDEVPTRVRWLDPTAPEHAGLTRELRERTLALLRAMGPPGSIDEIQNDKLDEQLRQLGYTTGR